MFFIVDAAGSFYLSFYDNELLMNDQLRSFHLEYLFLALEDSQSEVSDAALNLLLLLSFNFQKITE